MVKRVVFISLFMTFFLSACTVGERNNSTGVWSMQPVGEKCDTVAVENMDIKNPFIIYEKTTDMYYMVGDNGHMWTAKSLQTWVGPYDVLCYDTASWVGASPMITSPEIHKYNGKFYYMAAFETATRHSCTTLVANSITGPYTTIDSNSFLLDKTEKAVHPTFCTDEYGVGYMIYDRQGEEGVDGTVQIIRCTDDLGRRMGEAYVMIKASQIPWQRKEQLMPVIESPHLFYSGEEGLGILFTAYAGEEKVVGVAYSTTGTLNGPWVVENEPLLKGVNSVTMFADYDGTLVMLVTKDVDVNGVVKSVPGFMKVDTQLEKLQIKGNYKY